MLTRLKIATVAAALLASIGLSQPADAGGGWHGGGIGPGAAVALGLGSFALGSALANPYFRYYGYGYPPAYYPPVGYYPPVPAYYPPAGYYPPAPYYQPRSCWNGYRYFPC
jgi:hypothetical protein